MEHIVSPTLALHEEAVWCECLKGGTVAISSVSSNVSRSWESTTDFPHNHGQHDQASRNSLSFHGKDSGSLRALVTCLSSFLMLSHNATPTPFHYLRSGSWRIASSQRPRSCNNDDGLRSIISSSRLNIGEKHDIWGEQIEDSSKLLGGGLSHAKQSINSYCKDLERI